MRTLCDRLWNLQAKFTLREPHSWDPRQRTTWSRVVTSDFNSVLWTVQFNKNTKVKICIFFILLQPVRQSVAVDTMDIGVATDADCVGPCEPGTAVNLEGIVWHETDQGIHTLVLLRNKSYRQLFALIFMNISNVLYHGNNTLFSLLLVNS